MRIAAGATFLAALFLSVQAALGLGFLLSALICVGRSSTDVQLVRLVRRSDGRVEESDPPERLPSDAVTVMEAHDHLFYAGARTLERLLPKIGDARRPMVMLRLRDLSTAGATLSEVLRRFAEDLEAAGGRLYLTGLTRRVHDQAVRTGQLHLSGPVRVHAATGVRRQSTEEAEAKAWLVGRGTAPAKREAEAGSGDGRPAEES